MFVRNFTLKCYELAQALFSCHNGLVKHLIEMQKKKKIVDKNLR